MLPHSGTERRDLRVSVVTPTRDRPESLALCRRWFREQTVPVDEHLCIDGGTMNENLIEGMKRATGDIIITADDDDYIAPTWVAACVEGLRRHEAFGQKLTRLYHLGARAYCNLNPPVGPLAGSMAIRESLRSVAIRIMEDGGAYKHVLRKKSLCTITDQHVTELRGVYPFGLSKRQRYSPGKYPLRDETLATLTGWIGEGAVRAYQEALDQIRGRLDVT